MKKYYSTHLVKSEDLNHHGTLFAARTAAWFVESAFVAAACEHGNSSEVVCRNMHGMSFAHSVQNGRVVKFTSRVVYTGKTSMIVHVNVTEEISGQDAVNGFLTFVTIDAKTHEKVEHGIVLDEPEDKDEQMLREEARKLRESVVNMHE